MTFITLKDLSRAIVKILEIDIETAKKYANIIIDFFGFEDRIIDNILEPEDRRLFYMLEKQGILTSEREETTLYNGNEWRTHYWRLEKNTILQCSNEKKQIRITEHKKEIYENIYSNISKDMWTARKTSHA